MNRSGSSSDLNRELVPRQTYADYIASDAWRFSPPRLAEIVAAGNRCRLCDRGAPATLTVHHRTYRNLRNEHARDLTCLCVECHEGVTEMLSARALANRSLPCTRSITIALPIRILVDSLQHGVR
jgi:5-methylcytosine-specific restriction endonuclease McrA